MMPDDFDRLQSLMASRAGFRLARDRIHLAEHRLGPVARREGFDSVDIMLEALWAKPVASLGWSVIEALLNPETWFRRDRATFDVFANELLPALSKARPNGHVRLWSAGCSTGQEPYSLAMAALEAGASVDIVATDLSQKVLDKARTGTYTSFEIQRGLKAHTMLRWFELVDEHWVTRPELNAAVQFTRANLLDEPVDEGKFDIIMCRNVLTDVDPERRARIIDGLERRLVDDGCLFLGPDEQLGGDTLAFRPVNGRKGLFVKSPSSLRHAA
ncbi:protein-glutamate O-methyltransferase CheR [uncultured Brevundimonas sp.]|uniref:CheR family methyltransferase n=1 Tax=uncultured Brevundimonas sp. TaxID=213418 RepID=UPI0030EC337E|tara:strand:+ start:3527 stop:4342 length:816 start_codon:yes stop_codon:yes gene_type:complete